MKGIKKCVLAVLILAMALSLCACAFGGAKKIGKDAALQAALTDAGLTKDKVVDIDVEFEREGGSAWYEVDFESGKLDYEYKIDAATGNVLASSTD